MGRSVNRSGPFCVQTGMKQILAVFLVFAGLAGAEPIRQREVNQQRRIAQGVRSGELTRGETARLERQQRSIAREVRRDRVDGGGMTAAERAKAQARLDRSSERIYRLKHNGNH